MPGRLPEEAFSASRSRQLARGAAGAPPASLALAAGATYFPGAGGVDRAGVRSVGGAVRRHSSGPRVGGAAVETRLVRLRSASSSRSRCFRIFSKSAAFSSSLFFLLAVRSSSASLFLTSSATLASSCSLLSCSSLATRSGIQCVKKIQTWRKQTHLVQAVAPPLPVPSSPSLPLLFHEPVVPSA